MTGQFGLVFEENLVSVTSSFPKNSGFKKVIKTTSCMVFLNSGLKNVLGKLCFRDGLLWTVGLTVAAFYNSSGVMRTLL